MKLILLGAPGAGKGTQADILSKILNIPTISTGNILRAAVKNQTPIGLKAKEYMDAGALVPDEVIIGIIAERLAEPDCADGYILDGVPRTIPQAEAMEKNGVEIDCALSLEVEDQTIIDRMSGRRFEWRGTYFCFHFLFRQDSELCITAMNKQLQSKSQTTARPDRTPTPQRLLLLLFYLPHPRVPRCKTFRT